MQDIVEIGIGRQARRTYDLDDIDIIAQRRTRSSSEISTAWRIDAYRYDIPFLNHPTDAVASPEMVIAFSQLGGLGIFNGEGLWARHKNPQELIDQLVTSDAPGRQLRQLHTAPLQLDYLLEAVATIKAAGVVTAVRVSPQRAAELAPHLLKAGIDILVVQGTIISAEHVSSSVSINLKTFIADLDVPVIAGGVGNHSTALHLMRSGAAGIIVGYGAYAGATASSTVLGISVPMATAIADAAAARKDYLDETGGRYVHVIADGNIYTSGDAAKAIACGADAVMLGAPLARAESAPGRGYYWPSVAAHPSLPRGSVSPVLINYEPAKNSRAVVPVATELLPLEQIVSGPAQDSTGTTNFVGALKRTMAKTGFVDLKEFQRVPLNVRRIG